MTTRVETLLIEGGFGLALIEGLHGASVTDARTTWARLRGMVGYREAPAPLLTSGAAQQKLSKNTLPSFGLMLTPERGMNSPDLADIRKAFGLRGAVNLCPMASVGCAAACLSRSGQSGMPVQQRAQSVRTAFIVSHPREAGLLIGHELRLALRTNDAINLRMNVTSDIRWEHVSPEMVDEMTRQGIKLYDYTAWSPDARNASDDYSLTYSAKEPEHTTDEYLSAILAGGDNVAVPFDTKRGHDLPTTFLGFPVIDGDKSDERRNDPRGVVVGLRAKGYEWKHDNTAGFIRHAMGA